MKQVDTEKMEQLMRLADQAKGKTADELLPFFMTLMGNSGQNNGISFSPDEISAIIETMKNGKSPQEIRRIDKLCKILKKLPRST